MMRSAPQSDQCFQCVGFFHVGSVDHTAGNCYHKGGLYELEMWQIGAFAAHNIQGPSNLPTLRIGLELEFVD